MGVAAFFRKESGRKKVVPKFNARWKASNTQAVMSPR
jgi:hypothetical protein